MAEFAQNQLAAGFNANTTRRVPSRLINRVIGPVNLIVCAACLTLMFFESAFGICLGCKLYNVLRQQPAQLCHGGGCDSNRPAPVRTSPAQWLAVVVYGLLVAGAWQELGGRSTTSKPPWPKPAGEPFQLSSA